MPPTAMQFRVWLVGGLIAACFAGCGGVKPRNLPKSPVSGEVTFNGEHLPDGQLIFIHESGEMATVDLKSDGNYEVNVAQGKNQVLVKSVEISGGNPDGPNKAAAMEIQKSRIPDKYMMPGQSGLTVNVESGPTTFDVDLKSK